MNDNHIMDGASAGVVIAAIFNYVPEATAFLGLIWAAMRVYREWQNIRNKKKDE